MDQNNHYRNQLTNDDRSNAYAAIKEHFNLKHAQRTQLDGSIYYNEILFFAHTEDWTSAERFLRADYIIS